VDSEATLHQCAVKAFTGPSVNWVNTPYNSTAVQHWSILYKLSLLFTAVNCSHHHLRHLADKIMLWASESVTASPPSPLHVPQPLRASAPHSTACHHDTAYKAGSIAAHNVQPAATPLYIYARCQCTTQHRSLPVQLGHTPALKTAV
jgi:hypothetical protein